MPYKTIISNLKNPRVLSLINNNIGAKDAESLASSLKDTQIINLDLSNNKIGDEGTKFLAQALKDTQITNLNLKNNNIGDEGTKYLARVLKDTQITDLDLRENYISTDGAQYLNQILDNTKIATLFLDIHYTEDYGVYYISQNSYVNAKNIHVTLYGNKIETNGAKYLNKTFQNTPIAELRLDRQNLEADDIPYLTQAFKNIKILALIISYNHIMETNGTEYLVQAFRDSQIAKLDIQGERIGSIGAKYLAEFLEEIKIIDLNLDTNYIRDEGIKYLAPALRTNTILYLELASNDISADGAKYLAPILRDTQITYIDLCHNHIGVDGAKYLAHGLIYSQVSHIHLHGNSIEYKGYQYFIDVVDDTNISWVNLHRNNIEKGLETGTKLWPYSIPRNTTTIGWKICSAFQEFVSLNPLSNEFEFIVPSKPTYSIIDVDQYAFLIKTLIDNPNVKAHIFNLMCRKDHEMFNLNIMNKINEFIVILTDKFNIFINNNLPALIERSGDYKYVNLIKQFEEIKAYDIVQNLLLHRELYYIDENKEILHPYIYKMLNKYNMILYNEQLEPNKKKEIISYYQNHPEIEDVQEVIDLLESVFKELQNQP